MSKLIKVCGMRDAENIREVEALGIDLMGFIFYQKSPRNVEVIPRYLPSAAARTGVFVNEDKAFILEKAGLMGLSHVQLHGAESPQLCSDLRAEGLKVMKAFSVAGPQDLEGVAAYAGCCDMFVFDTKCPGVGGSGRSFDWSLLDAYDGPVPFLLSGGIGSESASQLLAFRHPYLAGYDLNSRFETAPAVKDAAAISSFLKTIKEHTDE